MRKNIDLSDEAVKALSIQAIQNRTLKQLNTNIMNTTETTRNEKIETFFAELDKVIDLNDNLINYIDIESIDATDAFNSIYDMIEENDGFNCEVIYYSNAIKYLQENDPSLKESFEIASELGYETENLNSEILASLLKSQNVRDEFLELRDEINEFFESLED